jgi:hypothetical protein
MEMTVSDTVKELDKWIASGTSPVKELFIELATDAKAEIERLTAERDELRAACVGVPSALFELAFLTSHLVIGDEYKALAERFSNAVGDCDEPPQPAAPAHPAAPTPPPADTDAGDARTAMIARQARIFEQNMELANEQYIDLPIGPMSQWALSIMSAVQNIAAYLDMPITEQGETR